MFLAGIDRVTMSKDRKKHISTKNSKMTASELAVFDFEWFKTQLDSEHAFIEMVKMLLEELPRELIAFRAAYKIKDWGLIQHLSHRLKGGISYYGAMRLKTACAQLENAIGNSEDASFERFYDEVIIEILLAEKTLREQLP